MTLRPVALPALLALVALAASAADGGLAAYRKLQLSDQFLCEGSTFGDFNRDGITDIVAGPYWYEGPDFKRRHEFYPAAPFDPLKYSDNFFASSYDFNGDGLLDIVTGKRWLAHGPKGDPDPNGIRVLYAFLLRRGTGGSVRYEPKQIDDASGVGVQLVVADANGDGRPDIVSANKRGTFVFLSEKK